MTINITIDRTGPKGPKGDPGIEEGEMDAKANVADPTFTDGTDETKVVQIDLSEVSSGTTRTLKLPDVDGALMTGAQIGTAIQDAFDSVENVPTWGDSFDPDFSATTPGDLATAATYSYRIGRYELVDKWVEFEGYFNFNEFNPTSAAGDAIIDISDIPYTAEGRKGTVEITIKHAHLVLPDYNSEPAIGLFGRINEGETFVRLFTRYKSATDRALPLSAVQTFAYDGSTQFYMQFVGKFRV